MMLMNKIIMLPIVFLLAIPMVNAEPMAIPIINKDKFKSCWFGWCQSVAPPFLFTDFNYTLIYNITNNITTYESNITNITYNITNNYTQNETEPMFNGNFSLFNPFYNQTTPSIDYFNSNPFEWINNTYNASYYLASNPFNFINSTYNASYYLFSNPYNFINSTFNSTYDAKLGNPLTANLNTSFYNITVYLSSASVPTCTKDYNSTGSLIWCDCYNNTHKWMANTC